LKAYFHFPVFDDYEPSRLFCVIKDFISNYLGACGKVLIFCSQGINESAAALLIYLVATNESWNSEDALMFLKAQKCDVNPDVEFRRQINEL
jgi:protein-tyrosine phosphatase